MSELRAPAMDVMDVVRLSIRCHVGKRKEEREGNVVTLSVS
jgi:hypothetical protein